MTRIAGLLATLAVLAPTPDAARGSVILYDNFGPGDGYQVGNAYGISGPPNRFIQGFQFTPLSTARLESIQVALGADTRPYAVFYDLRADAGGMPGTVIETLPVTVPLGPVGSYNPPVTLTSVLNPELTAGELYWLVVRNEATNGYAYWNVNSVGRSGLVAESTDGVTFQVFPASAVAAFRVNGLAAGAVPEPGTLAVFGVLATGALGLRRRK